VRVTKSLADGVDLNLTYARQEPSAVSSNNEWDLQFPDVQLLVAGVVVPF